MKAGKRFRAWAIFFLFLHLFFCYLPNFILQNIGAVLLLILSFTHASSIGSGAETVLSIRHYASFVRTTGVIFSKHTTMIPPCALSSYLQHQHYEGASAEELIWLFHSFGALVDFFLFSLVSVGYGLSWEMHCARQLFSLVVLKKYQDGQKASVSLVFDTLGGSHCVPC